MGVKLNDQSNGDEYRHNLSECMKLVTLRVINPIIFPDIIFKMTKICRNMHWYAEKVHKFSLSVINQRRISYHKNIHSTIKSEKVEKENMLVAYSIILFFLTNFFNLFFKNSKKDIKQKIVMQC